MSIAATVARQELTDHPHYKYRGCGPDDLDPRVSAGDPDVSVDAWAPYTGDGAEPQKARIDREAAAVRICGFCPVQGLCRAYANTEVVTPAEGPGDPDMVHLAEPEGVWGGQLALDRHRALIARRAGTDAPVSEQALAKARSPQKLAVLRALATELYESRVAAAAGVSVDRANWNRSVLCTLLGLDKETATRDDLLATAVHYGLLPANMRIRWDGLWPIAAAPNTDGSRQRRIAPGFPLALLDPLPVVPRTRARRIIPTRHTLPLPALPVLEPAA
ncbi:hypothetical protein AB0D56_30635 [Streptomyces sp. NPDC048209]|uniref:hypothetical protein n=1 Tax=Streptomyces sp. NPDC048209 TaxID=3156689 RepID=UPI003420F07B